MAIFNFKKANKVTEFTNSDASALLASKEFGKQILDKEYGSNAEAIAAGLSKGDIYHNRGLLRVVE